jgi:hypothetical protein
MNELEKELIETFLPHKGDPTEVVQALADMVAVHLGPPHCNRRCGYDVLLEDGTMRCRWPFFGARRDPL